MDLAGLLQRRGQVVVRCRLQVVPGDLELPPLHLDAGRPRVLLLDAEESQPVKVLHPQRGRHNDQPERSPGLLRPPSALLHHPGEAPDEDVGEDGPLVGLVDHDDRVLAQAEVPAHLPQQDAISHKLDFGVLRGVSLEPHLVGDH